MKTIGLLGGMSWVSTIEYYRIINQEIAARLGSQCSARIIIHSFDSETIYGPMAKRRDDEVIDRFLSAAEGLRNAGADFLLLGANTAHIYAEKLESKLKIPLLHITDVTAAAIQVQAIKTVGLLGTKYTMEREFYRSRLKNHGIEALVPNETDRDVISRVINEELCHSVISDKSRNKFIEIIDRLEARGAKGIILGCTEIPLLLGQKDHALPMFDTTRIHSLAAVEKALKE